MLDRVITPFTTFGALLRRELLVTMRSSTGILALFLVCASFLIILSVQFEADELTLVNAGAVTRNAFLGEVGLILLCIVLLVPGLAATAIVGEREQDTHDLLRLTLIRPTIILLGKTANSAGLALFILIGSLPFLSVPLFLVGLNTDVVIGSMFILAGTTLSCAAIGIYCSVRSRRTLVAIIASYFTIIALFLLPMFLPLWLDEMGFFDARVISKNLVDHALRLGFVTLPQMAIVGVGMGYAVSRDAVIFFLVHVSLASVALFLARRAYLRNIEPAPCVEHALSWRKRFPTLNGLFRQGNLKPPRLLRDRCNPIAWKDSMTREPALRRTRRMMTLLVFVIGWGMAMIAIKRAAHIIQVQEAILIWFSIITPLMLLACSAVLANLFTREYEYGNMDLLRGTLLLPRDIVLGKLAAALRILWPMLLAIPLTSIPLYDATMKYGGFPNLLAAYVTLCVTLVNVLALLGLVSMFTKKTRVVLLGGLAFGVWLLAGLPTVVFNLLDYLLYKGILTSALSRADIEWFSGFLSAPGSFALHVANREFVDKTDIPAWVCSMLLWSIIACTLALATIGAFERRHMRDR